ncbi:MAG: hypothetical protein IT204_21755 [Fimbriimonadaceae bacterium]|nr:hypothetical protein [Fimbriimonadaceae bacterium]
MPAQVHLRLDISGERQFSRRLHGLLTFVSDWQPFGEQIAANWKDLVAERFKHRRLRGAVPRSP